MAHKVHYRRLATWLAGLPLSANCADLLARIETFPADDAAYWQTILAELRKLPSGAELLVGVFRLCELLRADNPRFECDLFADWVLEVCHS